MNIRRAEPADAAAVAELIAAAFHPLRLCRWLVPPPAERTAVLAAQFRIFVEHAIEHGQVDVHRDGAAVWVYHDNGDPPPPPDYATRLAALAGEHLPTLRELDDQLAAHHPHDVPHHYLSLLAVRRDAQRSGVGRALLQRHHASTDARALGCYLDASNDDARRFYLRMGYRAAEPFRLGTEEIPMWPMWRPAGGAPG